ncbi:hypothetical protein Acsp06_50450 [Actinomycetospora sp. NBRC 106375]|uniref:hypothetical protein n=1 Tax=Actinomycetospora sp. NBRC 106375 TaxID=3032207 RepID=UPI0024A50E2C|nr:hypothetical protein [Actinomycetospora sp. NBRC 106375]GLZ48860.1 hypothetical protein Acsp06_50450 [Actinomycetospora sp. NBRC 106375]
MNVRTTPVMIVASRTEADLVARFLRSRGIRAAVAADDAGGQVPQLQLQGVRVLVDPSDEEKALRHLAAAGAVTGTTRPRQETP